MSIHPDARIHPAAIVEDGATIKAGANIGPFVFVGRDAALGEGVIAKSHCSILGWTEIGQETVIFPFATIGEAPQDLTYRGERTRLVIGKRNCIREAVTINTGTSKGRGITKVGDDCLFMTGSHVGHDCHVGNGVTMANQASLGGHSVVEDLAIISGLSGVHQFARVGRSSFVGALTFVSRDVLPYTQVQGSPGKLIGINLVGLRRRKVSNRDIRSIKEAYDLLVGGGELNFQERVARLEASGPHCGCVEDILEFVKKDSKRNYMAP
ncbi:MAG: acyl-ACP--UDP-N-acetylglucosamine O-acyltransferase [Albidovulum sp.]|nr:acyl-ACP--UDP-N-acetylglucosamine O-acyltransferase [Albidovulum sp.]